MNFNVVTGNAFYSPLTQFLKDLPRDYVGTLSKVQSHHGKLVHWRNFAGWMNFAFISDPDTNRELFVRHADALKKSPSQVQTFHYAAGASVATEHGNEWRKKRKEANALFSRRAVQASFEGQIEVTAGFVTTLAPGPQDAMQLARRMAALTSSRGILGRAISLEEADTQIAFSRAAADRFNAESAHLFARPDWMLAPWRKELTRRKNEVFPLVQRAVDDLRRADAPNDGLMNHYVTGDFVTSNDAEMLTILVGLLMGAQDNVAAAAAWVLAFLAYYPDLQTDLRVEIKACTESSGSQGSPHVQATICEILRLRPPAPANQPRVLQRRVEIAGHTLPKGTYVFNSFYNMHHDPSVFSDPETFTHKRFLDTGLERSPSFAPFGHGPRNCVAQGMAMQQISAIIAGLLDDHKVLAQQGVFPEMQQQPFLVPAPFKVVIEKA